MMYGESILFRELSCCKCVRRVDFARVGSLVSICDSGTVASLCLQDSFCHRKLAIGPALLLAIVVHFWSERECRWYSCSRDVSAVVSVISSTQCLPSWSEAPKHCRHDTGMSP